MSHSKRQKVRLPSSRKKILNIFITMASWWWTTLSSQSSKITKISPSHLRILMWSTTIVILILSMKRTSSNSSEKYVYQVWQKSLGYPCSSTFIEKTERLRTRLWRSFMSARSQMKRYRRSFRISPTRCTKICKEKILSNSCIKAKISCSKVTVSTTLRYLIHFLFKTYPIQNVS